MTKEEALEIIDRMPYIRTIQVAKDQLRLELYRDALSCDDPVEWIKIIKTNYVRQHDKSAGKRPSDEERNLAGQAQTKLHRLLSEALSIKEDDLERYIEDRISNTW